MKPPAKLKARHAKRTPSLCWVAAALISGCAQLVAPQADHADGEVSVEISDAPPIAQTDAANDAPSNNADAVAPFQPSYSMVVTSVDDGTPTGRATFFVAKFANPPPNAADPGSESVFDRCILRRRVGWIGQYIGPIRVESVWLTADAYYNAEPSDYSLLLANRTLPAEGLVTVTIPARDGFSQSRLSVAMPTRVEPIYPAGLERRAAAPLDIALPFRWQPMESRFSLFIDLYQQRSNYVLRVYCRVPTLLGSYTLPAEILSVFDRNSPKELRIGLSDLAVGTVRGVPTRFYSELLVASISDNP